MRELHEPVPRALSVPRFIRASSLQPTYSRWKSQLTQASNFHLTKHNKTDSIQTWLTSMETLWSKTRPTWTGLSWDRPERPGTALKSFQALSIVSHQDATLVSWHFLPWTVYERSKIFNMKQDHKATKTFQNNTNPFTLLSHQNCSLLCYLRSQSINISQNNSTENTFSKP